MAAKNDRPQQPDNQLYSPLPWQQEQWQLCLRALTEGRQHHALLLGGPEGVGKFCFAMALAQRLLCHNHLQAGNCSGCRSCELNRYGTHPDLHVLKPDVDKRQIQIGQIRRLSEGLNLSAHQQGWRVVVIAPAEAMNQHAANALLKQLEEPGAQTAFLLVSHEPGKLLPTIRSRCQQQSFPTPSAEVAGEWLAEQLQGSDVEPALALASARGRPLRALRNARGKQLQQQQVWRHSWQQFLDDSISIANLSAQWNDAKAPEQLRDALDWLNTWLLDCLDWKQLGEFRTAGGDGDAPTKQSLASQLNETRLLYLIDACLKARRLADGPGNFNPLLVLEELFATTKSLLRGQAGQNAAAR